jgi:glycosyltransferase involved in cell wall biosynthesis
LFYQVCLKRLIHFYLIHFYLVPGERSRTFLARNGVPLERIWTGFYSIDTNRFANVARDRQSVAAWPKAFLFVGQYIGRKGLPELLEAFGKANTEWSLILCGSGPRKDLVREHCSGDGSVVDKGFVQPGDLPAIMCSAGAFVLPSREDNWGLVALEAAAAGLPLACSTACGASAELVRVGKNGFLFHPGDTEGLVEALVQIASSSTSDLKAMSRASVTLAANYSASRWAENFWARISEQLSTA